QRLLPARGRAGGLRPAVEPEGAEPQGAALVHRRDLRRAPHAARRRLRLPRPDAAGVDRGAGSGRGGRPLDLFAADPRWGWWIILYFYLGGIAAGAYFLATTIDVVGDDRDRELARIGYWLAFPLILLCALFLTVDLSQPTRFWHMLLRSEDVEHA